MTINQLSGPNRVVFAISGLWAIFCLYQIYLAYESSVMMQVDRTNVASLLDYFEQEPLTPYAYKKKGELDKTYYLRNTYSELEKKSGKDFFTLHIYVGESFLYQESGGSHSFGADDLYIPLDKNHRLLSEKEFNDLYMKQNQREGRFQKHVKWKSQLLDGDYERYSIFYLNAKPLIDDYYLASGKINDQIRNLILLPIGLWILMQIIIWVSEGFKFVKR